jgi:hypothetical protein
LKSKRFTFKSSLGIFDDFGSTISSVNDKILMENAERLGRIERELIGKKSPIKPLQPIPLKSAKEKVLTDGQLLVKAVLLRDGCVSIKNAISSKCADELLKFVNNEKLRTESAVKEGLEDYDDRFGAVNNRLVNE